MYIALTSKEYQHLMNHNIIIDMSVLPASRAGIQRKAKGQQPKGKIVSALFFTLFALFHSLSHCFRVFQNFSPGLFLELRGFTTVLVQRDKKRIKKGQTILHVGCCTFVVLSGMRHNAHPHQTAALVLNDIITKSAVCATKDIEPICLVIIKVHAVKRLIQQTSCHHSCVFHISHLRWRTFNNASTSTALGTFKSSSQGHHQHNYIRGPSAMTIAVIIFMPSQSSAQNIMWTSTTLSIFRATATSAAKQQSGFVHP